VLRAWIKEGILLPREAQRWVLKDRPYSLAQVRLQRDLNMKELFLRNLNRKNKSRMKILLS
jgi:hypothetical protein